MNKPIIVAVVSVSINVTARIIVGGLALLSGRFPMFRTLLPIVVGVLILVGIIKGQRLAWQWGRLLGIVGAIGLTLGAILGFIHSAENPKMIIFSSLLALQGIPLFPMFFALGTKGAKEHFRVICPSCGDSKVKGGNFIFTKVVCRKCNTEWP